MHSYAHARDPPLIGSLQRGHDAGTLQPASPPVRCTPNQWVKHEPCIECLQHFNMPHAVGPYPRDRHVGSPTQSSKHTMHLRWVSGGTAGVLAELLAELLAAPCCAPSSICSSIISNLLACRVLQAASGQGVAEEMATPWGHLKNADGLPITLWSMALAGCPSLCTQHTGKMRQMQVELSIAVGLMSILNFRLTPSPSSARGTWNWPSTSSHRNMPLM